ncbi:Anthocyanin 5-aromatic acyltransferase [Morus notabilis]|uniref:Anthocyanin 5-aromatic acyltransferase n=1 Tax=Morus notabilis TaxID=981085 RepID=W9R4T0_9ROSA|nr:Anthocyanin 5-aromatic acyltransferase [Morus notabilis]
MHHAVVDGKSFFIFMKSWAHICRSLGSGDDQLPLELKPAYDRSYINDPADLGTIFSNRWLNMDGPDNRSLLPWKRLSTVQSDAVRGTFQLPRGEIEKLKRLVNDQKHCPDIHVSTFSVTYAYTFIRLVKAEEISDNKVLLRIGMDFRSRLDPALPATYFGNCLGGTFAVVEREALLGKGGLFVVVNAISEAIKGLGKGLLDRAENWVPSSIDVFKTLPKRYGVSSSPRFAAYNTDFGWGKPTKVEVTSIRSGTMSLSDNRNGDGGVEIGLVLRKHHMKAFASLFAEGLESL